MSSGQRLGRSLYDLDEPRVRRLAARPGSCSASRPGRRPRRRSTRNWPELPATFSSPVAEGEPGQVAHVLAADAEVGVDAGRPRSAPGGGPGEPVGPPDRPSSQRPRSAGGRRRREVRRDRPGRAPDAPRLTARLQVLLDVRLVLLEGLGEGGRLAPVALGQEVQVAVLRVGLERRVDRGRRSACQIGPGGRPWLVYVL